MFPGVVGEFCEREQVHPVVLVVIAKDPQELFDLLIDPFCFSICLGMISHTEGRGDS